ncbi:MAG TPA: VOC family protein [Caldilineaceae bacterium]|nr:VOC family protein [Caldilineaceae bacterium]
MASPNSTATTLAEVRLTLEDGSVYSGPMPVHDVVHLALDRLLPHAVRTNHRISVYKGNDLIYPDMFLYEIIHHYGDADFRVVAEPLDLTAERPFVNYGFDHLALAFEDRQAAKRFFHEGLGLQVVRDDEHLTVVTSGATALFLFDFDPNAPLAPPAPSRIHHLGFVVDDLEAAAGHLQRSFPEYLGEFTLLEREERWSLYGHAQIGSIRFMIQLSQIKPPYQGLKTQVALAARNALYDYASQDYGVRLG